MTNQQSPEPPVRGDGLTLDLHSIFLTLQGEGPHSGRRAVFVRLAGCNLQCPGCDTEYTQGRTPASIYDIKSSVMDLAGGGKRGRETVVVITGGEPLRQPIGRLVALLLVHNPVQIESNGTAFPGHMLERLLRDQPSDAVMLVVSPKTASIHPVCYETAHAFKYVLDHRSVDPADGLPLYALEHERGKGVARPREGAPVYLTPYDAPSGENYAADASDGHNQLNRKAVAESCLKFGYTANLQVHKYLGLA